MSGCLRFSLNSFLHSSIGDTPNFIVFGQDKRLSSSILIQKEESVYSYDNYIRVRISYVQKIYKRVTNNIDSSREKWNAQ